MSWLDTKIAECEFSVRLLNTAKKLWGDDAPIARLHDSSNAELRQMGFRARDVREAREVVANLCPSTNVVLRWSATLADFPGGACLVRVGFDGQDEEWLLDAYFPDADYAARLKPIIMKAIAESLR